MLLDTYHKNLATQMCGNPNSFTFKGYEGTVKTYAKLTSSSGVSYMSNSITLNNMKNVRTALAAANTGVVFGDGTAEVSKDDYKLSGNVISTISASAADQSTHADGQIIRSYLYTITNAGSEPITISEIGYYDYVGYGTSWQNTLLERTLLETPLTIPAGGVGQVEYTIRINYPTA